MPERIWVVPRILRPVERILYGIFNLFGSSDMGIVFGLGYILVFLLLFVSLVCFVFVILGIINVKNKKN